MKDWDQVVDVVVAGSGAAGLSGALTAARRGLEVLVVEKSAKLGGTTAMSGAGTWIPANHHAAAAGIHDSKAAALLYLHQTAPAGWADSEADLWAAFVDCAPEMLRFVEENTPLRFELIAEPDPFAEVGGGRLHGRMLSPLPLSRGVAGRFANRIRRSTLPQTFSYGEGLRHDFWGTPVRAALAMGPTLAKRLLTGEVGQGNALVAGLLAGCVEAGVRFATSTPVCELVQDDVGAVVGIVAMADGTTERIRARRGVLLATGGFEWDREMLDRHFPGIKDRLGSPDTNTGDGQRMALAVGAQLSRMDQANIYPTLPTRYEGKLHGLPITFQAAPHAIVVNGSGRRFASEFDFNIGERLDERDTVTGAPVNSPAFLVSDRRFMRGALAFRRYARLQRGWIVSAPTIPALARKVGLPEGPLADTVERWNGFCGLGRDGDFRRGETAWERYKAGLNEGETVGGALGSIEVPSFYAMSFNRSILGTKGGARTDASGRVLRGDGSVIAGLYSAGLVMANPIGTRAVGPGTTIGPCLTWGYICGLSLASKN